MSRVCVCCGFASENQHLFKRANTESQGRLLGYGDDDWICRSYWACAERERMSAVRENGDHQ